MTHSIQIFAHRGASGHALENSFKAFNKAIIQKADGIELDLQVSKDGEIFVYHDLNLKRLAGIDRFFSDCLANEISDLRLGSRFFRKFSRYKIPKFSDFIKWHNEHPILLNIELKETFIKNPESLISWLKNIHLPKGSHISSFYPELLKIVKQTRPDIETAILVTKQFKWDELEKLDYADAIHANKKYYKSIYLDAAAKVNKKMRFYSITGEESYVKNPHPIVVGWITDYPLKLAHAIGRK